MVMGMAYSVDRSASDMDCHPPSIMPPQELNRDELRNLAECQALSMLGVPWDAAIEMLERGDIDGTGAQAELRMLRFLLDG